MSRDAGTIVITRIFCLRTEYVSVHEIAFERILLAMCWRRRRRARVGARVFFCIDTDDRPQSIDVTTNRFDAMALTRDLLGTEEYTRLRTYFVVYLTVQF